MGRVDSWITTVRTAVGQGRIIDPLRSTLLRTWTGNCGPQFGDLDVLDATRDPFNDDFFHNTGMNP
jgi:hypothetical protein